MASLEERLRMKGWTEEEIAKAMRTLKRTSEMKSRSSRFLEGSLYWIALLLATLASFFMAVMLVPLLIVASGFWGFVGLAVFGLSFGLLFEWLHCRLEGLSNKEYIISGIYFPAIALINVYIITRLSNRLSELIVKFSGGYAAFHSPALVAWSFLPAFLAPYIVHKLILAKRAEQ